MGHEQIALWTELSSDPELIAGVRAGDAAAFGVLYERHAGAARKVAAHYTNTPTDIDDVVSESFSRVLRALQRGDGPDLAFRAYLFTIVRRTGMDLINKGIRTKPRDDMTTFESAMGYEAPSDEHALDGFEQGIVADAFKSLPERWQAVLWYTEVEKKSPREIAPLLGLSANGVAALAYRAREALRQAYLQQHLSTTTSADCLDINSQLGAFVRGGLSAREQAKVDAHISACASCAALVFELEDVNKGMRSVIAPMVLGLAGMGALEGGLPIGGALGAAWLRESADGPDASGIGADGAASGSASGGTAGGATGAGFGATAAAALAAAAGAILTSAAAAGPAATGAVARAASGAGAGGAGSLGAGSLGASAGAAGPAGASAMGATSASGPYAGSGPYTFTPEAASLPDGAGAAGQPGGFAEAATQGAEPTGAAPHGGAGSEGAASGGTGTAGGGAAGSGGTSSGAAGGGAAGTGAGLAGSGTAASVAAAVAVASREGAALAASASGGGASSGFGPYGSAAHASATGGAPWGAGGAGGAGGGAGGAGGGAGGAGAAGGGAHGLSAGAAASGGAGFGGSLAGSTTAAASVAGASSILIPAGAAAGVIALALAGASYLGVFDGVGDGPTLPPEALAAPPAALEVPSIGEGASPEVEPSPSPAPSAAPPSETPEPPPANPTPQRTPAIPANPVNTGGSGGGTAGPAPDPDPGTDPDPGGGSGGGTDPEPAPVLAFTKAPLDYLEIPLASPSLTMTVANGGAGAATPLLATIDLPAGLAFAAPSGGGGSFRSVTAERLADFVSFAIDGDFTVDDWTCAIDVDATSASCELASLAAGTEESLDLELVIGAVLADDASTTFTVASGAASASYTVLTGVEENDEDIDVVYSAAGHMAATHVGATLMGCPASESCSATMASVGSGTTSSFNNNGWAMVPLNEAGGDRNSATTTLSLPTGATVTYASLEWAANRHSSDTFDAPLDSARLKAPGSSDYVTVTADSVEQSTDPDGRIYYQSRLDVTDLVNQAGSGDWSLADIALPATYLDTNRTYFGGFALTVVYEDPSLAHSRVAIFDGSEWVSAGNVADFSFATDAAADATLSWTTWEGDRGLVGDRVDIDGTPVTPLRWDGSTTSLGDNNNAADATAFGGRHGNTLGVDVKQFRPGSVGAGVHEVTVGTSGDNFLLSTLTVTIAYE